jgi:hypothetical protein
MFTSENRCSSPAGDIWEFLSIRIKIYIILQKHTVQNIFFHLCTAETSSNDHIHPGTPFLLMGNNELI